MQLSLKRNLIIGFGISLLILLVSTIASFVSIKNLLKSSDLVSHTTDVVRTMEETLSTMKDAETGQRGYLLTGLQEFLDPYNGSLEKINGLLDKAKQLTTDNDEQQQNIIRLGNHIHKRFSKLQALIDQRRVNGKIDIEDLKAGKVFMDSVRQMVAVMSSKEEMILKQRNANLTYFSNYTPVLIVVAAVLAVLITVIFYLNMNRDISIRTKLQEELLRKDAAISHRIQTIREVSDKISSGDYSVRVDDTQTDSLGNISGALNKMAASLQTAFNTLSEKEWLQTGVAGLNEAIIGDDNLHTLTQKIITYVAEYTNSQVGAIYVRENDQTLVLENGYALEHQDSRKKVILGEGAVGQCAQQRRPILLTDIKETNFNISYASASLKPANIVLFPLVFETILKGVIELGSLQPYTKKEQDFFKAAADSIAIAINTVRNRQRVQELLEETQAQAEELMAQQTELEQINAELEAQAQHLQTSEEELKVQSEELIETNTLLEEKSAALEQRNQLIMQKNAEIERKAEELAMSTKYKSEFLANMSHELRTPLNSILLLSRLMAENNEKNLTEEQVQYAKVIQTSGNGLLQLIDEILDISKIESGKMTIEYMPVKVTEITSSINELFEPMAKERGLEWRINVDAAVPETIETDKLRLEQILKNLLSNAFKFTSSGYIHLTIDAAEQPGFMCFTVKDSGIGISADKQDLIFEAFQQEDGSTRRKYGGTGLGLSISRELSKLLGGEITLHSVQGEGSEFTCCIPVKHSTVKQPLKEKTVSLPEPTAMELPVEKLDPLHKQFIAEKIPADIADDRATITPGDKVILIIEDDVHFATALLDYARQKGYKGVVAVRGDAGIEMAAKYMPVGILLDVQLPVKTGWQVMDALKNNMHTRHIPVHMMSSFEVKKESLMKGAVDFINKPVAFEKLNTIFDKIEYILNKRENKVLIIEDNYKHAKALAYYLGTYNVHTEIFQNVNESVQSLHKKEVDCVILDASVIDKNADQLLGTIRENEGLEDLPIILFTGKSLSQPEEFKIKKYADTIVMKTANSYQRILDEVSLFLHLVQEQQHKRIANFESSILQENVLKNKSVLLADDDVRNIYSMTKALERYQMSVIPAMDGKEAIQLLQSNPVDIILMDMMMPQMDGYESIKAIRKNKQFKNLPIIAVTAKAMSGDREKCIAAGASDYISKPVDMDQLISLLRIWLYEKGY